MNKLTNVESKDDFARLLGFSNSRFMNYVLYVLRTEELYETFTIPKKSGGERTINAPKKELKILQKKLANLLWDCYIEDLESESKVKNKKIPNLSHAYEKNKSIITNAKLHRNKKYVLNIDLEDFFDSFNFGRVRGFLLRIEIFVYLQTLRLLLHKLLVIKESYRRGHLLHQLLQI
jgi:RNA-directed DNA polymerase from retron ec67